MADKELAAKLARRLQAQNETDEEPKPETSEPPPVPVIPQKIVSNPHVAADNSVNIDDLILNTLLTKEANNNTGTTASASPLVSPKALDSNGNVTQSPMSPPPKTTIRNLLERDYQNNPASTQAAPSRPLVGIVHHKKEERPSTPTRQKTPDGSELERKLEAQRRKKIALDEESNLVLKQEVSVFESAPIPPEPFTTAPLTKTTPESSNPLITTDVTHVVTPTISEIVPEPTKSTVIPEIVAEVPVPRPRKSSFEELEEMFEKEAKEEAERIKMVETKKESDTQLEQSATVTQVSQPATVIQEEPVIEQSLPEQTEPTTIQESANKTEGCVTTASEPTNVLEATSASEHTQAEETIPEQVEQQTEQVTAQEDEKSDAGAFSEAAPTVSDEREKNQMSVSQIANATVPPETNENAESSEENKLVEADPESPTVIKEEESKVAEVLDLENEAQVDKQIKLTEDVTDQDLEKIIQQALLKPVQPIVTPEVSISCPTKAAVPSPLLIEAIRIECGGLKSPPPPPPPKPQTPTHSRPQSPAIFKKAPVSPAMSSTSTEGQQSCTSTEKKSVDVDSCDELTELLERRQKIIEGDAVPDRVNRKLSLYAEFSEFSRKQIKFFTETFTKYDEDRDGFIDFNELKRMMEKLGEAQTHIALKQIIQKVDEDKDGKISLREFLLLFRLAAEGHFGCSEVFTQLAGSVDVSKEGVLGAASFFQAKIAEQTKLSKFEEEIKQEQDERKKEEEERKQRREKFLQNKSIFH